MSSEPKRRPTEDLPLSDEWHMHRVFSHLVFDTFLRIVVRDSLGIANPTRVTLQVEDGEAVAFIWEEGRSHVRSDAVIYDWAVSFLAGDLLDLDAESIDMIYLDGEVGGDEPCLHIVGNGVLIISGETERKGRFH